MFYVPSWFWIFLPITFDEGRFSISTSINNTNKNVNVNNTEMRYIKNRAVVKEESVINNNVVL
jgi:hypothetical protein